ncbi:MAG: acylphosphatase, partial [Flavobacteriales bacterium]
MKHKDIRVRGKVQGVFYRATMVENAMRWGIKGFVRNETDGSVYIEAEGDEEALEK